MVSAWYSSAASIKPDARALARSIPFPCETATDRELGRHTITTGIPTESKPVTLATRVIPMMGAKRITHFNVCSTVCDRCVPCRKTLRVPSTDPNVRIGLTVATAPACVTILSAGYRLQMFRAIQRFGPQLSLCLESPLSSPLATPRAQGSFEPSQEPLLALFPSVLVVWRPQKVPR